MNTNQAYLAPTTPVTVPRQNGYTPPMTPQVQNQSNIIWVQGIAGAKAYPVPPNTSVMLMDSENQVIYIKMTDASGVPQPLRILDFTEREPESDISSGNFVTEDRLNDILDFKLAALADKIINNKPNSNYHKKGQNNG